MAILHIANLSIDKNRESVIIIELILKLLYDVIEVQGIFPESKMKEDNLNCLKNKKKLH